MAKIQKLNKDMIVYVILFLFLVMFSLKPGFFSQLFQTVLGRSFLVFLIIYITYCNQIGGTFFVLFLMIFYSGYLKYDYGTMNEHYKAYDNEFNENYSLLEGFSSRGNNYRPRCNCKCKPCNCDDKKNNNLTKMAPTTSVTTSPVTTSPASTTVSTTPLTTTSSTASTVKPATTSTITTTPATPATTNTKSNVALEGFDLLGFEDTMKRGKQSNSIFVSNKYSMNDAVMPYDHSMFSY